MKLSDHITIETMPDYLYKSARQQQPVWKQRLQRVIRAIQNWMRELCTSLIEIIILFTAVTVLAGILLSFVEAFWYLYLQTPVGMKFTADPSRSSVHLLTQLIQKDLFWLSVDVATAAMAACLSVSAACQLLALRRYFYEGRRLLARVIWLSLFSAAAAFILERNNRIDIQLAFGVAIAPCLCLFSSCQNIAKRLLPELTPFAIIDIIICLKNACFKATDQISADPQMSLNRLRRDCLQTTATGSSAPAIKTHRTGPRSDKVPG